jgi:hypothetical protein
LESPSLEQRKVAGFCEYGNERNPPEMTDFFVICLVSASLFSSKAKSLRRDREQLLIEVGTSVI